MAARRSFEVSRGAGTGPAERASLDESRTRAIESQYDTEVVQAVSQFSNTKELQHSLKKLIDRAQEDQEHFESATMYNHLLRDKMSKAVFVGHVKTDLDSVAGAIGAAALFGGTPAISEPADSLNGEIVFALKNAGVETPMLFDDIPGTKDCDVVLVDHTEEKQMVPSLRDSKNRASRIIGVLDHHALASSFYSSKPLFMDLRPWGSVSTIIAVLFLSHKKHLPRPIAVLLLHAILSDTLNLRSVTTTEADRGIVALLATYGEINTADIDRLAKSQFQAKTNWVVSLGAYEMVRGDQKDFQAGDWKIGISVLEVTDTTRVMEEAQSILMELRLLKKEKGLVADINPGGGGLEGPSMTLKKSKELDFAFLFVVNIVEETSVLLIAGGRELALARAAFMRGDDASAGKAYLRAASPGVVAPGSTILPEETSMQLPPGFVSRKAQFVPAFFDAIDSGFAYDPKGPVSREHDANLVVDAQRLLDALEESKRARTDSSGGDSEDKEEAVDLSMLRDELFLVKTNSGNFYNDEGRICRRSLDVSRSGKWTKMEL